jgi:hypothetical protein
MILVPSGDQLGFCSLKKPLVANRISDRPETYRRYSAAVESTAYVVVAEAIHDAAGRKASHAAVSVVEDGESVALAVEDDGAGRTDTMLRLADRVGAQGGRLTVEPTRLQAELPCG